MRWYLKSPPEIVYVACLIVFLLGMVLANSGCTSDGPARETLATATRILKTVDAIEAVLYREHALDCMDRNEDEDGYSDCMQAHNRIVQAQEVAYASLLAVQSALDAAGDARRDGLLAAAPCAAQALDEVIDALTAAGVHVPEEILDAAAMFSAIAPGSCAHGQ